MNPLNLPEPIFLYFTAEHGSEALAQCFSAQAVVKDDGHTYTGVEAIKAFIEAAAARYNATIEPFALKHEDGFQVVHAHVSGNFPGSPVDLSYRFRLDRGLIASLEIAP